MFPSLRNATLLVSLSIAATVGFSGIAGAAPLGIDDIAKNRELDEGVKNHGAVVSEAARHHGGGNSARRSSGSIAPLNSGSTLAVGGTLFSAEHSPGVVALLASQNTLSSPQSIPEPRTLLLLCAGFWLITASRLILRFGG